MCDINGAFKASFSSGIFSTAASSSFVRDYAASHASDATIQRFTNHVRGSAEVCCDDS
jgi:hypothetical protein